jgi:hypothetical protein
MTRISDASGDLSAAWPWWLFPVALAFLAACIILANALDHAPLRDPEPSRLDILNGVGRAHCSVQGCDTTPTVNVHAGHDYWPM